MWSHLSWSQGARHALSKQARCSGASHSRSDMSEVPENIVHPQQHDAPLHHHCSQRDTSPSEPSTHQRHQQHHPNHSHLKQDSSCAQGSASTVLPFPSVVGAMSTDPKTPAHAQCAVESGGLAAFLRDTAAERARDVHAFQEAVLSEFHRHTGFDFDGLDKSTSANQVPVTVFSCCRSNPSFHTCATSRPCSRGDHS